MTTYYHVAPETYNEGENLYSFSQLEEMGIAPEFKWSEIENYPDAGVVCMFETLSEAEDFQFDHNGVILKIELPGWAGDEGIRIDRVGEGYPCILGSIPASLCGETVISVI